MDETTFVLNSYFTSIQCCSADIRLNCYMLSSQIVSYPRSVSSSVRREDDRRKERRKAREERRESEREQKNEELKRLKKLKRREIKQKLEKIKSELQCHNVFTTLSHNQLFEYCLHMTSLELNLQC